MLALINFWLIFSFLYKQLFIIHDNEVGKNRGNKSKGRKFSVFMDPINPVSTSINLRPWASDNCISFLFYFLVHSLLNIVVDNKSQRTREGV